MFEGLVKKYITEELDINYSDEEICILKCLEEHLREYLKDENDFKHAMVLVRGLIRMQCAYNDITNYGLYELLPKDKVE